MTVSRDPSDYEPTNHALQRAKYRGIDLELVAETIEQGECRESHEDDCKVFVNDFEHTDNPVRVVANVEMQSVITAAWDYNA
jgi:transcriptional/translational regulatory protein YebC/TACO1